MSGAMENRAAVFTSSPQNVEVYRDGGWWAGSLLGWRHDAAGACQVWIRVDVRGVEETSWLPLDLLRLPEPPADRHLSVVGAGRAAGRATAQNGDPALTGAMAAIRAVPAPRGRGHAETARSAESTATMSLVAVRNLPEDTAVMAPPRRPGGRRRAPEPTVEQPVLAPEAGSVGAGRHRVGAAAAAAAGRHRAADTGVWPAVRDDEPAPMTELPRRRTSVPVLDEPDAHLLTRPMRLTDSVDGGIPRPRRGHVGGRLSGV